MQPPPRKGNYTKFLKNLHVEQISKLQIKNQTECELLEDLRSFIQKKSSLEKSYNEALLKMTSVYLNKKIATNVPDLKTEGSQEKWNAWSVWRNILEENENLCRIRLAAIDLLQEKVVDDVKVLRLQKLQSTKKCIDLLACVQKEVQGTVQDLDKCKKLYFDEEHVAHDVRDKAKDIEAKLKKKKGSFFQSLSTLQKTSTKVSMKRELLDDKSTGARNDYLFCLASANAHQTRYFVTDLQNIMLAMENNVYDKMQEYFSIIARAELYQCQSQHASFARIRQQAQQLTREYNLQCLYLYCPALKQHIEYQFEACKGDSVDYVTFGTGANTSTGSIGGAGSDGGAPSASSNFSQQVKAWIYALLCEKCDAKRNSTLLQKLRAELNAQKGGNVATADSSLESPSPPSTTTENLEMKIDELLETLRKSKVLMIKLEAKIDLLRKSEDEPMRELAERLEKECKEQIEQEGGWNLDGDETDYTAEVYVQDRQEEISQIIKKEDYDSSEEEGTIIDKPAETSIPDKPVDVYSAMDDWGDDDNDTVVDLQVVSEKKPESYQADEMQPPPFQPFECYVLYNYTSQNEDELTIVASEKLQIMAEGDGEGWLYAQNGDGAYGLVPCTYLDLPPEFGQAAEASAASEEYYGEQPPYYEVGGGATSGLRVLESQISFSSVDYTVNEKPVVVEPAVYEAVYEEGYDQGSGQVNYDQGDGQGTYDESAYDQSAYDQSAYDQENYDQAAYDQETLHGNYDQENYNQTSICDQGAYCRALYAFEGDEKEGELNFGEGKLIKILRKIVHDGIDDGWWEGELMTDGGTPGKIGLFPSLLVEECYADGTAIPSAEEESAAKEYYSEGDFADYAPAFAAPDLSPPPPPNLPPPNMPPPPPPDFSPPEVPPPPPPRRISVSAKMSSKDDEKLDYLDKVLACEKTEDVDSKPGAFKTSITDLQQHQYDSQFSPKDEERVLPTVVGVIIKATDEDTSTIKPRISSSSMPPPPPPPKPKTQERTTSSDTLGVTQIVITAATPNHDCPDRTILSKEEEGGGQSQAALDEAKMKSLLEQRRKSAGEINEAEPPPLYDVSQAEAAVDHPTTIVEEEEEEEEFMVRVPTNTPTVPEQLELHQLRKLKEMKESRA